MKVTYRFYKNVCIRNLKRQKEPVLKYLENKYKMQSKELTEKIVLKISFKGKPSKLQFMSFKSTERRFVV